MNLTILAGKCSSLTALTSKHSSETSSMVQRGSYGCMLDVQYGKPRFLTAFLAFLARGFGLEKKGRS